MIGTSDNDWKATADTLIAERREADIAYAERRLFTAGYLPKIADIAAEIAGVPRADLSGPCRHSEVIKARRIYVGAARALTTCSLPEVANALGNTSHSSACHQEQAFNRLPQHDRDAIVAEIRRRIG